MAETSEHIGTLFQLQEECRAGDTIAQWHACLAADALTGLRGETDWCDAVMTLWQEQRDLRRALKGRRWVSDADWQAIADAADRSLYAEIDLAIVRTRSGDNGRESKVSGSCPKIYRKRDGGYSRQCGTGRRCRGHCENSSTATSMSRS